MAHNPRNHLVADPAGFPACGVIAASTVTAAAFDSEGLAFKDVKRRYYVHPVWDRVFFRVLLHIPSSPPVFFERCLNDMSPLKASLT